MRRDVNLTLLLLIIVSILVFSGFSVYYQTTFKDISLEYQEKLGQLSKVSGELSSEKEKLNETYTLRLKAEADREALDTRYRDVSDENENLKQDNSNLRSEIGSTKSDLAEKSAELDATRNLLAQTQNELSGVKAQRDRYESDLEEVCEDYTSKTGEEHPEC